MHSLRMQVFTGIQLMQCCRLLDGTSFCKPGGDLRCVEVKALGIPVLQLPRKRMRIARSRHGVEMCVSSLCDRELLRNQICLNCSYFVEPMFL